MTKGSQLRAIAERQLPKRLTTFHARRNRAFRLAKRPGLPRSVQRERRLAARAEHKRQLQELGKIIHSPLDLEAA